MFLECSEIVMFWVARIGDSKWAPVSLAGYLQNGPWAVPPSEWEMKMLLWEDPGQSPLGASSVLGQRGQSVHATTCVVDTFSPQQWERKRCHHQIQLVFRRHALERGSDVRKTGKTSTTFPSEKPLLLDS